MNFKQYFTEANEEGKGAFKEFPKSQQPKRISLDIYPQLTDYVQRLFGHLGDMYIPSATKSKGKTTAGDLDVIFVPKNRNTWRNDILKAPGIIAHVSNGPQLMLVMKNTFDSNQYMIDFILSKPEEFEHRKIFHGFGVIMPAVLGSFARSLRYKYGTEGLFARIKDSRNNFHNIKLSTDPNIIAEILMLDPKVMYTDQLFTPEGVAQWITSSPRFDSNEWHKPTSGDGQTIVTVNKKAHRAARKTDVVTKCFKLIDSVNKLSMWDNTNYKRERQILGDDFVNSMLAEVERISQIAAPTISGNEIMNITGLKPGPEVGKLIKDITARGFDHDQAIAYLKDLYANKV